MKYSFIPLFVAVVVVMTSLSECMDSFNLDGIVDAPISADINGVTYSSESYPSQSMGLYGAWLYKSISTGKYEGFRLCRSLYYNKSNSTRIEIKLSMESLKINHRYNDFKILYYEFIQDSLNVYEFENTDGWIEFTDKYEEEKYPFVRRIAGKFEFTFTDDVTAKTYEITNGVFDVPYKDSKKE